MLRQGALTILLATASSVLVANQPWEARHNRGEAVILPVPALNVPRPLSVLVANQPREARRNRGEAVIPPVPALNVPPPPVEVIAVEPAAENSSATEPATTGPRVAEDQIDGQAQVVELAAGMPAPNASWTISVTVGEGTRCAFGLSADCLANDARLRAVGIMLSPDEPGEATLRAAAAGASSPASQSKGEAAPDPALREVALPRADVARGLGGDRIGALIAELIPELALLVPSEPASVLC